MVWGFSQFDSVNLNNSIHNSYENSVCGLHPRLDKRKQIICIHSRRKRIVASVCNNTYLTFLDCFVLFLFYFALSLIWCGLIVQHVGAVSTEGKANKTQVYKEFATKCVYKLLSLRWTGERHYISVRYYYLSKSSWVNKSF